MSPCPAPDAAFGWRFVAPLLVAGSLNPINTSIIATALVPISQGLGGSAGRTAVLVAAVYLPAQSVSRRWASSVPISGIAGSCSSAWW